MLIMIMLSVVNDECPTLANNAEYRYAECRYVECRGAPVAAASEVKKESLIPLTPVDKFIKTFLS